jgi:hypothetical protein
MVRDDTVTSGTLALKFAEQVLDGCKKRQNNRFELNKAASSARVGRSTVHKLEIKIKSLICLGLGAVSSDMLKMITLYECLPSTWVLRDDGFKGWKPCRGPVLLQVLPMPVSTS